MTKSWGHPMAADEKQIKLGQIPQTYPWNGVPDWGS